MSNKVTSKACMYCERVIPLDSKRYTIKKFCSVRCGKHHYTSRKREKSKLEKRLERLYNNDEWDVVVHMCERSGTVQILAGHTVESLHKTLTLIRNRPYSKVDLCHIAPITHPTIVGKLHHLNLVYCGTYQNARHSNNWAGGGRYIRKSSLEERWSVFKSQSKYEIMALIRDFLGGVLVEYLLLHNIPLSRREKSIKRAIKCNLIADDAGYFDGMTAKEINAFVREKKGARGARVKIKKYSKYRVYLEELRRVSIDSSGARAKEARKLFNILIIGYFSLRQHIWLSRTKSIIDLFGVNIDECDLIRMRRPEDWSEFKDLLYILVFKFLHCFKYSSCEGKKLLKFYTNAKNIAKSLKVSIPGASV